MADVSVEEAYRLVFATPAGIMVLRDMASETGFMAALPKGADASLLIDHNAVRRVFGRIYEILALSNEGREALVVALRPTTTQE